ncbi:hypothetical protein J3R82DRAFT_6946 [Butyriboletus roseoflavus]|nr:hypothetical protein J3R82DRAFT_6946 [Butyriboletus roseoflavus]
MSWFASSLQSSCETDLANQVVTAMVTLNALHAYDLMRNVACQVDPAANSYCYVEAVANPDPSNYWFYQLPLGQKLGPNITTSACNGCTSELMASYASALNSTNGTSLTGLAQTYNAAADTLNNVCGSSYAKTAQVSGSASKAWLNAGVPTKSSLVALGVLVLFAGILTQ